MAARFAIIMIATNAVWARLRGQKHRAIHKPTSPRWNEMESGVVFHHGMFGAATPSPDDASLHLGYLARSKLHRLFKENDDASRTGYR